MVAAQEDQIRNLRFLMCRAGRPDPGPCSSALAPESPMPRGGSRVDAYGVNVPAALGSGYATTGTLDPKPYIYIYIYISQVYLGIRNSSELQTNNSDPYNTASFSMAGSESRNPSYPKSQDPSQEVSLETRFVTLSPKP